MRPRMSAPPLLVSVGTRVVIVRADAGGSGAITEVRTQSYLKPYVVTLDTGTVAYCSGHDLALEADGARKPLAEAPVY